MMFLLNRYFFVLKLLVFASIAFFLAKGTGELIAQELQTAVPDPPSTAPPRPTERPLPTPNYIREVRGDAILARNLFDSSMGTLSRHPKPPPPPIAPVAEPEETLEPCDRKDLRLDATVAMEDSPGQSMACVSVRRDSSIYHVGDALADGEVAHISWQYVIIDTPEGYCYLDLFDTERRKVKKRLNRRQMNKGIKPKGRYRREVKRAVMEQMLDNPTALLRGIKARPYRRGSVQGYKIRRLSRSHPAHRLGLRKNDIVKSVNGTSLANLNGALSSVGHLKKARRIKIDLLRKRKPQTLDIRVR